MIFLPLLAASALDIGRGHTLAEIEAGYAKVMSAWDADHDDKLSRSELSHMVDAGWKRSDGVAGRDRDEMTRIALQYFRAQDTDRDGFLTMDELSGRPRAEFVCTDRDHNGVATSEEIFAAMSSQDCGFGATAKSQR